MDGVRDWHSHVRYADPRERHHHTEMEYRLLVRIGYLRESALSSA
jgi:hypothetical protein